MQDPTGWLEEWNSELGKEAEGCYLDLRWAGSSDFQQHLKFGWKVCGNLCHLGIDETDSMVVSGWLI